MSIVTIIKIPVMLHLDCIMRERLDRYILLLMEVKTFLDLVSFKKEWQWQWQNTYLKKRPIFHYSSHLSQLKLCRKSCHFNQTSSRAPLYVAAKKKKPVTGILSTLTQWYYVRLFIMWSRCFVRGHDHEFRPLCSFSSQCAGCSSSAAA